MFQQVVLIGNVGRDPKTRFTQAGTPVSNFSVATSKSHKDNSGEWKEKTTWHKIVAWGKLAETCQKMVKKGAKVLVVGEIEIREYEGRDKEKKKTSFEIVAHYLRLLSPRPAPPEDAGASRGEDTEETPVSSGVPRAVIPDPDGDSDIPF